MSKRPNNENEKSSLLLQIVVYLFALIILVVIFAPDDSAQSSDSGDQNQVSRNTIYECERIKVGYLTYKIIRSKWVRSHSPYRQHTNASHLAIKMNVKNGDKKARMIPQFHLIDGQGAQYDESDNQFMMPDSIGLLDSLNPSVSKTGWVLFDVPRHRDYKLKVAGGYWSSETAYIQLSPEN